MSESLQNELKVRLQGVLDRFAVQIGEQIPTIGWHLEFPNSRRQRLVGLLVFHPPGDRSEELAVVSIEVPWDPPGQLTVDLADRESVVLSEATRTGPLPSNESGEPALLAEYVETFLTKHGQALVTSLARVRD